MRDATFDPALQGPAPATLGPYEIAGELGRGGMGRVYRARDTRLGRDVAIKVLHREPDDPRRIQRFLAEARAASALNHPNILAVYDVGTEGDRPYIVSELIEGVSLRTELEVGAMAVSRVLELATQIADGLAAAHQARLVHRDLKPENVMISRGRAKVVDFGLAKDAGPRDDDDIAGRTVTAPHTILGTPPYMSPEQARGAAVDYRSDQFSFGAMVYEMATGCRAFSRDTPIETLTAIQHDEPGPMRDFNPRVPGRLQDIVQRCLAKSPDDRYGSTADLHHDLRALRDGRVSTDSTFSSAPSGRSPWRQRRVLRVAGASAAVVALLVVGALALQAPPGRDLSQYRIVPIATEAGYEGSPAWSPDGRTVAYIAERNGILQVMARDLDSTRSVQLSSAVSDCRGPMWSADGARVYYISLAGSVDSLWSVSAAGGASRMEVRNVTAAAMAPDGSAVVFLRDMGAFHMTLWVSSPVGQEPARFAEGWSSAMGDVRFSPDGAKVGLWHDSDKDFAGRPAFTVIDFPSGTTRRVLETLPIQSRAHPFAWLSDNRRIVFGADLMGRSPGTHLWIADTESGDVEALTASSTSEYEPSVSPDGRSIAFVADASHYDVVEVPTTGGPIVPRSSSASDDSDPVWSPTGRQYAYVTTRTGRPEVWLSDPEGAVEVPLVSRRNLLRDPFLISRPAISPDGQRVVFQQRDTDGYFLWTAPTAGGQAVATLPGIPLGYADAPTWSASGEWIAFIYLRPQAVDRWILGKTRPGSGEVVELRQGVNFLSYPQWSPDGQWITAELPDGLYAISPDSPAQRLISREPWLVHTWSRDSKRILAIRQSDDNRLQLASIDLDSQQVTVINPDLGPVPPTTPPLRGFSLSPDGTRLLTSIARLRGDIHVLDGFEVNRSLWSRIRRVLAGGRQSIPRP